MQVPGASCLDLDSGQTEDRGPAGLASGSQPKKRKAGLPCAEALGQTAAREAVSYGPRGFQRPRSQLG